MRAPRPSNRPRRDAADLQLRERTYHELKRRLLGGEWSSEPMLSQRRLARLLGTSNTPVRSAVERLEAEGLVRIEPRRGVVLRELDAREVGELYEFRAAIESYVVEQLAGRLSPGQIRPLRDNLETQRQAVASGDSRGLVESDATFHAMLCAELGNREIVAAIDRLRDRIRRVILQVITVYPRRMAESVEEHAALLEAIEVGDAALAAQRLREHLGRGRALVTRREEAAAPDALA